LFVTAAAAASLVCRPARAGEDSFPDFSRTTGLTLGGSCAAVTTIDGRVLRLTSAMPLQSGSAFASVTVDSRSFSTAFAFKLSSPDGLQDPAGEVGGDGIVFAIQSKSASLGGTGGGLGIEGVKPSVAVEFDTWKDDVTQFPMVADPSSNHIGVDINGNVMSVVTAEITPQLNDGHVWYVWIDYDGAVLSVRLGESSERPEAPALTYPIDIPAILGVGQAYVGFAAGTGLAFQNQDVLRWTYHDAYVDGGVGPDSMIGVNPDGDAALDMNIVVDDRGSEDGGVGIDGAQSRVGGTTTAAAGCTCEAVPASSRAGAWALLFGAAWLGARRRRGG
jgi:hypothetical protein